jgi:hypothetical protein
MPKITSPNSFGMEPLHELTKDGFNAVTHMGQETWIGLFLVFGRFVGSQEIKSIALQALREVRFPIIAVCQHIASDPLQDLFGTFGVGEMSGSQGAIHQNPWPCQTDVSSQPIVNVARDFIVAIRCCISKRASVRGSCKTTDRYRKAIDDGNIWIVRYSASQFLPQVLFHLP